MARRAPLLQGMHLKMRKIKLYYSIVDTFPPFRVDVADLFGNYIAKKNVEITWFMQREKPGAYSVEAYENQTVNLPYKFSNINFFSKLLSKFSYWLFDLLGLLKLIFKDIDIIQTRDKYIASLLALFISRIKRVRYVYWCSYPFPELALIEANKKRDVQRLWLVFSAHVIHFVLYKIIMRLADHSFVQSQQMLENIAAYGVPKNRMTAVPMGVPSRLLGWTSSNAIAIVSKRIVYLGTLDSARHLDMLIDAFALVHNQCATATLLMVGEGVKPQDRSNLAQQVVRLGLADAVTFTGFVPIEQAWSYAASAAVCVSPIYPSFILNCGSPTKLHEYMALGRPVVCNHHPEQTYVINESAAGLCVEWGAKSFATAILWMLNNAAEAELAAKNGPTWIAHNRAYPAIADDVLRKYQQLLQANKR